MKFTGLPHRNWLGRIIRLPLKLIPAGLQLPILQGNLRGRRWIAGSSYHACWVGSYEYEKRIAFEKLVAGGSIVFDIGAHVGFYTLLASILVGPEGRVFAFEPLPDNLFYLYEHLRINRITNAAVIEAAVSDAPGATGFATGKTSMMGRISPQGQYRVKTVTIDGLVSNREVPPPDFIKIDVEGGELPVLAGAKRTLAESYPVIFLSTHGPATHRECCNFLREIGYALRPVTGEIIEETDEIIAVKENSWRKNPRPGKRASAAPCGLFRGSEIDV